MQKKGVSCSLQVEKSKENIYLNNVEPSDELALDVQLGEGGPVGEGLEPLTHVLVLNDVKCGVLGLALIQKRDDLPAEAALGLGRRPLHEQHHGSLGDQLKDERAALSQIRCFKQETEQ